MSYNREFEINEEQVVAFLQDAVNRVKTEENIDTLSKLIKIYKKNVPLSLRKYVAASLLKEALKHDRSFFRNMRRTVRPMQGRRGEMAEPYRREFRPRTERPFEQADDGSTEERIPHPRVQIDPSQATSIFISIGRNRRVYPRDLVGLLVGVAGIDRERIGDIKVLANYSFIQLYTEDTKQAIEKLNGYDYRGRKLAVSYSRLRDMNSSDEAAPENDSAQISARSGDMAAEDAAAYAAAEKAAAEKEPFSSFAPAGE